jgi:hypothetical protein
VAKIDLRSYTFSRGKTDFRSGEILKKVRQNKELEKASQSFGLITTGIVEATQVTGGYGWGISSYIEFSYAYSSRPIFTWGLDGTAELGETGWAAGDNKYTSSLPATLSALTTETYQPAMFIPRVIHWHIENNVYLGCYLLICQVNSTCTELDKTVRVHFRFEGSGFRKASN